MLFPLLSEKVPMAANPVKVMLAEHEQGREHVRAIAEALPEAGTGDPFAAFTVAGGLEGYAGLLRAHIDKENKVLFRARRALARGRGQGRPGGRVRARRARGDGRGRAREVPRPRPRAEPRRVGPSTAGHDLDAIDDVGLVAGHVDVAAAAHRDTVEEPAGRHAGRTGRTEGETPADQALGAGRRVDARQAPGPGLHHEQRAVAVHSQPFGLVQAGRHRDGRRQVHAVVDELVHHTGGPVGGPEVAVLGREPGGHDERAGERGAQPRRRLEDHARRREVGDDEVLPEGDGVQRTEDVGPQADLGGRDRVPDLHRGVEPRGQDQIPAVR